MKFIYFLIAFLLVASPADAAPVGAAVFAMFKAVAAWKIAGFGIGSFLLKTGASFALSLLARARIKPGREGGLRSDSTLAGEGTSASFILGKYATAGCMVCPPMTDGRAGKLPNGFLTYVVDLGDIPVASLDGVWVNDDRIEILGPSGTGFYPDHQRAGGKFADRVWFRFFDGRQTAAYQGLIDTDGNGRPWQADMIGTGIPYVVMRFKYDRELFQGMPNVLFEVTGIGLYDPRKDSTVGGTGAHRWGASSTYEPSENPAVQIYNILRGIPLPDGTVWGGTCEAADLPLANWFAGMNTCDVLVDGEPQFRSSFEVRIGPEDLGGDSPADVIDEILGGTSGQISEFGGVYRVRFGGVGLPVAFLTDDDLVVTSEHSLKPFPGLQEICNAVHAQYPDPTERWANKEAPPRYSDAFLADDAGHLLVASLQLAATPYPKQVQRIQLALMNDDRRFRSHEIVAPADYAEVEPLDAVAWGSETNGYASTKVFEVTGRGDSLLTMLQTLGLRERDSGDYIWRPDFLLPSSSNSPTTVPPAPRVLTEFSVEGTSIPDGAGRPRRAAIGMRWDFDQPDVTGVMFEIRPQGQTALAGKGSVVGIEEGRHVTTDGVIGAQTYEVRGRPITRRASAWGPWLLVTTPNVQIDRSELEQGFVDHVEDLLAWSSGANGTIADLEAEIEADRLRVDTLVQGVRADLGDDVAALQGQLVSGLASARGYTETAIDNYDVVVQGQFGAVAGQIEQLTAALTSEDLLSNGSFETTVSPWTLVSSVRYETAGQTDPLLAACPAAAMVGIGVGSTGSIAQSLNAFSVTGDDRLQLRFSAATTAGSRTLAFDFVWLDGAGSPIGAPISQTVTVSPANQWKVYSLQVDPPDNAVGADLTITKTQSGTRVVITKLEASTINVAIEARMASLEAAQVTDEQALAVYKTEVAARFQSSDAYVASETAALANADMALGNRIDTVEASFAGQQAEITQVATTIANAEQSIAQLNEEVSATYGRTQLVRDPEFARSWDHWVGPGAIAAHLAVRAAAHANPIYHAMPGRRAFRLPFDAANPTISTARFDVAASESYVLSAYFFRQTNALTGRVWVQFFDANGEYLSDGPSLVAGAVGSWLQKATSEFSPPATARQALVRIAGGSQPATANSLFITGITLDRLAGFDAMASSTITEVKATVAEGDATFSIFRSAMESNFNSLDGRVTANATNIAQRYTRAQTDSAISTAINSLSSTLTNQIGQKANSTAVNALSTRVANTEQGLAAVSDSILSLNSDLGRFKAGGLFRVFTTATPTGARARIAMRCDAEEGGSTAQTSSLFLEAGTDGMNRIVMAANELVFVGGSSPAAPRTVPFYVRNGRTYIADAVIDEATIGTLHLKAGSVVAGYTFTLSGSGLVQNTWTEYQRFNVPLTEASRAMVICKGLEFTSRAGEPGRAQLQLNGFQVSGAYSQYESDWLDTGIWSSNRRLILAKSMTMVSMPAGTNYFQLAVRQTLSASMQVDVLVFKR